MIFTMEKDDFIISTDKLKLDISFIHQYLSKEAYWCKNISLDIVKRSIDNSISFGMYHQDKQALPAGRQVGFARVITDKATFGYLADVFIINDYRGRGLSKWLMQCILGHPELKGLRGLLLGTKDAHGLYSQFGFKPLEYPERFMRYSSFTEYPLTDENK
jgi:N-acetylglutamate synthase-like GNAT family acetyltransferase